MDIFFLKRKAIGIEAKILTVKILTNIQAIAEYDHNL